MVDYFVKLDSPPFTTYNRGIQILDLEKGHSPDGVFILADVISVAISFVALYMLDQYQLNLRLA